MRALRLFLRTVFFFIAIAVITGVAAVSLVIGGLVFLLLGRRPRFQVYSVRTPPPPMKDVTPQPTLLK